MGIMACSCKRLQSRRVTHRARGYTERLPGGARAQKLRYITVRGLPELHTCTDRNDAQVKQANGAVRIMLQASLFAVAIAVPFTVPSNAWARKQPKEEPVVTVVEDPEPEFIQKARELAKQAEEQATKALQSARTTSETAVEYVRQQSVVAVSKAQELKQQLVTTYGNKAALEKPEVQAAGAVVALVVLVVLFKAVASLFSSSAEEASKETEVKVVIEEDTPSAPPPEASSAPKPVEKETVEAPAPVLVAAISAAEPEPIRAPLDLESAAVLAAEMSDLYQNNPQQFAVMAEWLQSPAAATIRPRLMDELQRLVALATSSQDEEAPQAATPLAPEAKVSSNGVVKTSTTKPEKQVDARQLITMVEWLRSPGAAPVRNQLGADVADQVAMWASRRVGLPDTPAASAEPVPVEPTPTLAEATEQPSKASLESPDARKWINSWAAKQNSTGTTADARQWIDSWAAKQAQSSSSDPTPTHVTESLPTVAPQASVVAAPSDVPSQPAAAPSLGEVMKQKGAATPALIALGLGALALDLVLGKSPTKKTPKRKATPAAAAAARKQPVTEEMKPDTAPGGVKPAAVVNPPSAQPVLEAVASKPSGVELEAVTFSFDEGPAKRR